MMQASSIQVERAAHFIEHSAAQVAVPVSSGSTEMMWAQASPSHGCLHPSEVVRNQVVDAGEL